MKTKVTTEIDGQKCSFIGILSLNGKMLRCDKGMILHLNTGDKIEHVEQKPKQRKDLIPCQFDMHQFFRKTKQI